MRFWAESPGIYRPEVMLGDMNVVEVAIDCLSIYYNLDDATEALLNLKTQLSLADSWHRHNPSSVGFSFYIINRPIQSQIDRIYLKEDLLEFS